MLLTFNPGSGSHLCPWPGYWSQSSKVLDIINFLRRAVRGRLHGAIFLARARRHRTGWTGSSRVDFRGYGLVSGTVASCATVHEHCLAVVRFNCDHSGWASHLLSNLPGITSRLPLAVMLSQLIVPIKWISHADFLCYRWTSISLSCISFYQHH